jgi:hypothetical protein
MVMPSLNVPAKKLATTDRAIDVLVHELYGLTAEEIRVVEGK